MPNTSVNFAFVVDTFLLLLIGLGPKIALVPFLDLTTGMDPATKRRVTNKMLTTAGLVAIILIALGELLTRLLHFSLGALSIAGGIVLLIISVSMVLVSGGPKDNAAYDGKDPAVLAVSPLAVPYLLNPVGIVVLVTLSGEARSFSLFGVVVGILAVVMAFDVVVFRFANRLSEHLNESRLLITEKVFGVLLSALAVQLVLNGLSDVGVIHLTGH